MGKKFVLVKSYYGLGGDFCVLLGAWRLARQLRRELVVDWSGGRYGSVEDGNLFRRLFDEPHFLSPADVLDLEHLTVFPEEWVGRAALPPVTYMECVDLTQSRPDDVPAECSADCIVITRDNRELLRQIGEYSQLARSVRPHADIRKVVDEHVERLQAFKHSIGIHFRHGNGEKKVMAPDPRWFRNRINGKLKQLNLTPEDLGLYVATDCGGTLDYFKRYYPHVVDLPKVYLPNGSGAMHVSRDDLPTEEKIRMAADALVDIYTLAQCRSFVGSRGYFSLMTRLLREDRDSVIYSGVRVVSTDDLHARYVPATRDPVFGSALKGMRVPVDGLLVNLSEEKRTLMYYHDPIAEIPEAQTSLTTDEQLSIRRLITARRTY